MKKLAAVLLIISILLFASCSDGQDVKLPYTFVPEIYSSKPQTASVSVSAFTDMTGNYDTSWVRCNKNDVVFMANAVLDSLPFPYAGRVRAVVLNSIVLIELGEAFNMLADNEKAILAASLARTYANVSHLDYLMLYSGGVAASFSAAQGVYITPLKLSNDIRPKDLLDQSLANVKMLQNHDDFALPALLWLQDSRGIVVPQVREIVMDTAYPVSVFNALCTARIGDAYGIFDGKAMHVGNPEFHQDKNNASFKIIGNDKNNLNINTDMILLTMWQYSPGFSIDIGYYSYANDASLNLNSMVYVGALFNAVGFLIDYYQPSDTGFDVINSGVTLNCVNMYTAAADYCLRRSFEFFGLKSNAAVLVYDVWDAQGILCVSLSEECAAAVAGLTNDQEQKVIYSLVNSLLKSFEYESVRLLIDGKTARIIGDYINTEQPLHFAMLKSQ